MAGGASGSNGLLKTTWTNWREIPRPVWELLTRSGFRCGKRVHSDLADGYTTPEVAHGLAGIDIEMKLEGGRTRHFQTAPSYGGSRLRKQTHHLRAVAGEKICYSLLGFGEIV